MCVWVVFICHNISINQLVDRQNKKYRNRKREMKVNKFSKAARTDK